MIRLFSATATDFSGLGLGGIPDAVSCKVVEERNGSFELTMVYPVTGIRYADMIERNIIVCKPNPYSANEQAFEIYRIVKGIGGTIEIYAQHISYRLSYLTVAPFEADSALLALRGLKLHVVGDTCPFDFDTDKQIASPYVQTIPASIRQRLGGEEGSILDLYGGEYEWDNWAVKLWASRGQNRGVTIRYGKNLIDLTQELNIANTYTGIVPYWKGVDENGEDVVVSPNIAIYADNADLFPYKMTVPKDFSDAFETVPSIAKLNSKAGQWVRDNELGLPSVSLKVSFVDLRKTTEYANVAPLEQVMLCDTVNVYFERLGVSATAKVIKTTYDALLDQYDSVELGDAKANLSSTIRAQEQAVVSVVEQSAANSQSYFSAAIEAATEMIRGGYGGYVVMQADESGLPYEITIMDEPSTATAKNCIRMNRNGIAFSQTGYNGTFTSAWTIDGKFLAQNINVVDLSATSVTSGVLQSQNYNPATGEGFLLDLATGDIFAKAIDIAIAGVDVTQEQHFVVKNWDSGVFGAGIQQGNNVVLITGDSVQFIQDMDFTAPVAKIDQKKLVVTHGHFKEDLRIGRYKWIPRTNGNLSLVYIGTEDE